MGLFTAERLSADYGMWPLNGVPTAQIKDRYGAELSTAWLQHVQKSAVAVANASGCLVSADGLFVTAEHVGRRLIQGIQNPQRDYAKEGFSARSQTEELKCLGAEVKILVSIEDVTARVEAAVTPAMDASQALAIRRTTEAAIEKEGSGDSGLISQVVTLYEGARSYLYSYKRYRDVRLVFIPERQAAALRSSSDDPDPRGAFDVSFFRVYENGVPAKVANYFKWSVTGVSEGDPVFILGNPVISDRAISSVEIEYQRDIVLPKSLAFLDSSEVMLEAYSKISDGNSQLAERDLAAVRSLREDADDQLSFLLQPGFLASKQGEEKALLATVRDPAEGTVGKAWAQLVAAQREISDQAAQQSILQSVSSQSWFFEIAHALCRVPEERAKLNDDRLSEYRDDKRPVFESLVLGHAPTNQDYEKLKLAQLLTYLARELGADSPTVRAALAGMSPADRATDLMRNTRLAEKTVRKQLYADDGAAVKDSKDPLVLLVETIDPALSGGGDPSAPARASKSRALAALAQARLSLPGAGLAPDASGTLRLAFGSVKGYELNARQLGAISTFHDLFAAPEAGLSPAPLKSLPASWSQAKETLDLGTSLDFATTCDIVGGNSGSATLNKNAELVGVMFGHIDEPIRREDVYSAEGRTMSVSTNAVIEALRHIYHVDSLVDELLTGGIKAR